MGARPDVVVVGAGNAAFCAALAAAEHGARVLVLERAPADNCGGNTAYTAGAFRVAYRGAEDIVSLAPDLTEEQLATTDFGSYDHARFFADMSRVTEARTDPDLVELLVMRSFDTLRWMRDKGVRFFPGYGRQAFKVDGRFTFWGGLTVEARAGGTGLVESLTAAARRDGIEIVYGARARELVAEGGRVTGVRYRQDGQDLEVRAGAVVLAAGGFEANTEWRTRYLGPGWDLAKVRGTRFNTGDGIKMALEIGAMAWGNWSGAHAVQWDMNAPSFGDPTVGDAFQKHSYPFGIIVNARGERFLDEGANFRNYTYAKYGREVLAQPGQFAWQVFDAKVTHLLRDEYRIKRVTKVTAQSLEELAQRMEGVDAERFLATVGTYNDAVDRRVPFNPTVLDGRGTIGLAQPKSNWANVVDEPPFSAFGVTCGVTFTFGGLRISTAGEVISEDGSPIAGLYAAGELVGGLFYFNYPGGAGLTSGSVFGRIAGTGAALAASAHA